MARSNNNYAKAFGKPGSKERVEFFDDRRATECARIKRWIDVQVMAGFRTAIYRRPFGLVRGFLDNIPVVGDLDDVQSIWS
jgi:hypothetical protein